MSSLVEAAAAEMGSIDILINSAGMNIRQFVWDVDDESWGRVITTNLTSTLYLCRAAARHMRKNGYGKIINMSSMKSFLGVSDDGYASYCAS